MRNTPFFVLKQDRLTVRGRSGSGIPFYLSAEQVVGGHKTLFGDYFLEGRKPTQVVGVT